MDRGGRTGHDHQSDRRRSAVPQLLTVADVFGAATIIAASHGDRILPPR
jgi:hypothetical protein